MIYKIYTYIQIYINIKYTAYTNYTRKQILFIFVLLCCFKLELKRSFFLGFTFEWIHVWRRLRACCCKQMIVNLNGYSGAAARHSTVVVSKGFNETIGFKTYYKNIC